MSENVSVDMSQYFYRASAADFMKIPGSPVTYWLGESIFKIFDSNKKLSSVARAAKGLVTANNDRFVRDWHEVNFIKIAFNCESREAAKKTQAKWFPYSKGGGFRRWYGNFESIVNWKDDGLAIQTTMTDDGSRVRATNFNLDRIFKPGVGWTVVTSGKQSFRFVPHGYLFDAASGIFQTNKEFFSNYQLLSFLNSKLAGFLLNAVNPTLNLHPGYLEVLPFKTNQYNNEKAIKDSINLSKIDWDSYETSWEFSFLPLLAKDTKQPTLEASYKTLRANWLASTLEMQRLEEENNRIFIDAYGLQDELTPDVPLNEITLTCNPHYRYRGDLTEQEREDRLQSDTIAELISYAIGCMMGRYSLDREGLVYANENNDGFAELVAEEAYKSFPADGDGILALTAEEWFEEDIANRFSEFLAQVWGKESLQQNIDFVAQSLCLYALKARSGETSMEVIRRYLSTQFFKDHMNMYKRRPIYWLFSSGRHKAFECLVYLHRYNESTLARMRTEYVIPHTARLSAYATRLAARIEAADSTAERNRLNREQKKVHDQQAELAAFDEQLRHAADQRIQLDLDDGVKVNYGKFGNLLAEVKAIAGK